MEAIRILPTDANAAHTIDYRNEPDMLLDKGPKDRKLPMYTQRREGDIAEQRHIVLSHRSHRRHR